MLATLLIFRQFLQNIKEVLQPYLYEQNKLGVFTPKVLWELLQAIMLKYGRLALGKAQASMTAHSLLGPRGIPVSHAADGNPETRRRGDLKAGFRLTEEEWDMTDSNLKQRKVSFTEKVDYQDVTTEVQPVYDSLLEDSPTLVEEGMDPSSIFDSCDEDSDCESLSQVCALGRFSPLFPSTIYYMLVLACGLGSPCQLVTFFTPFPLLMLSEAKIAVRGFGQHHSFGRKYTISLIILLTVTTNLSY